MPEWMAEITLGQTVATAAGLALVMGVLMRLWRPIKRAQSALESFMADWNGSLEVKDGSGTVIKPKIPGVIAQIEVLRDQLQNSHQASDVPNLRDDLDTKATKEDVAAVVTAVGELAAKVAEHITIAKESDRRQDETGHIVSEYLPKIQRLLGEE